ncbi:LemA family protein [Labrys wisconsinensis]|uniref:LemA protein n=1 Tax=Labrys wisconsinensis TaxID=425677 RepID=A0ABU0J1D2_9HYPH|nr:LemA family protein [Labrys wisconsinensis]MDQ0467445.1 LemA protein [Labrys wisconsinensis]
MTSLLILGAIVLIALYAVSIYNSLVRNRNLTAEGWSGIDVQLRRRADLVPNLIETVKGYAAHEKAVFDDVTAARARSIGAQGVGAQAVAETGMQAALGRLFAVAEAYPELKADANFRELQTQLATIEEDVQSARRYYNGAARNFNTLIESFPSNLVARQFGFQPVEFFAIGDEAARAVPKVDFGAR